MKKQTFKLLVYYTVGFFILCLGFILLKFPTVEPITNLSTDYSEIKHQRGQHLVHNIAACTACHNYQNPNFVGGGGRHFSRKMGFPGDIYSSNITPHNLSKYSDEQLALAIVSGIKNNKDIIFPVMPYTYYRYLSKYDLESIIIYLRHLPKIENDVPERKLLLPMKGMLRFYPKKHSPLPNGTSSIKKGYYLSVISGCIQCHSQKSYKDPKEAILLGGRQFTSPENGETEVATNITPHNDGIGKYTKETFIKLFKNISVDQEKSIMPWTTYENLTEEELGNIYDFLNSLNPVQTKVEEK